MQVPCCKLSCAVGRQKCSWSTVPFASGSAETHSNKSHCLLETCLYVSCFWHWTLLNTSGHPNCIFLPANGTGMLLFNIKRSHVGVTSLVIPAEELLVETFLTCLWPPSCNRSHRWSPTWRGRARVCVFNYSGTPFTQLHNGPQNTVLLPRGSWSKCDGVALGTGDVPLEIQLAVRNVNKCTHWLLFICLKCEVSAVSGSQSIHRVHYIVLFWAPNTECKSKHDTFQLFAIAKCMLKPYGWHDSCFQIIST